MFCYQRLWIYAVPWFRMLDPRVWCCIYCMNNNLIKCCFRNITRALFLVLHSGMYHIVLTHAWEICLVVSYVFGALLVKTKERNNSVEEQRKCSQIQKVAIKDRIKCKFFFREHSVKRNFLFGHKLLKSKCFLMLL